jgi:hypothetical protein
MMLRQRPWIRKRERKREREKERLRVASFLYFYWAVIGVLRFIRNTAPSMILS